MENDNLFTRLSTWIKNNRWAAFYRISGAAFGVAGIVVIFWCPTSNAKYTTTAGIAVFAVLYVIAQAVERIVEWVTDLLKLFPKSSGAEKAVVTRELRAIDRTINRTMVDDMVTRAAIDGSPTAEALRAAADDAVTAAANAEATKEVEVDDKRTDVLFLAHGLSIFLAAIAVNWMNYGIMDSLGATNLNSDLNRLLTALAAAGGSKALHELIGRVQVAKENAQTTP